MTTNHTPTADYPGSGEHVEILLHQRGDLVAALSDALSALYQCASRDSYREFVEANPSIVALARAAK